MSQNMKAERARMGLTIKEVADRIGVHANAVSRWENDEAEPNGTNLINLAKLYGVAPEYLLGQTDDRTGVAVARVR